MRDLFKAELLRFRAWGIAAAVVHLLVLGFFTRVVDLAQQPLLVYRVFGGIYIVAGLLLGLYQMGSYRRANVWLNLLHRPLPTWRIATALCSAGTLWLAMAAALPVLIIAGYQEGMTALVIDMRHWLLPLASCLMATCGYLAGAYAMLANRRWSTCGLVFLVLLAASQASGLAALAVQILALVWLALLVVSAFKPDLAAPPRSAAGVVATALPIQVGVYVLVLLLGFGIEMLWIMQGTHPNNMAVPPAGGPNETERMTGAERMLAGLAVSQSPKAPLWREQIALSEVYDVGGQMPWQLERNTLTNHWPMEFDDGERRLRWVFSHDSMRFEAYSLADKRAAGNLGVGIDNALFTAPAMAVNALPGLPPGDTSLIAGNALYHYVSETGRALPRIVLPAGEVLSGVGMVGENLVAASDQALYLFDGDDVARNEAVMTPRTRVAIPGKAGDLRNIDLIELVDGYLLSFSFTSFPSNPRGVAPYQTLLWVNDTGTVTTVARRAISHDYPAVYRYKSWWPSPALYALRMAAVNLFAEPDPLWATSPPPIPRSMKILAGGLMLLSLLGAVWMVSRRRWSLPARLGWIAACALIGLPALASLWLLYPEPETFAARAPSAAPAVAA